MAKEQTFDWYSFLAKKVFKCKPFKIKQVFVTFRVDGPVCQGDGFHIRAFVGNSWDCPVRVRMNLTVTPNTLMRTKKQAEKLVVVRQWEIPLRAGEIVLASAPAYACFDCKPCSISFTKAKVSKEGKGKRIFKRKGKSMGFSMNPVGLLLLPLGFVVISWSNGAGLEIPVRKDKTRTEDDPANLQQRDLSLQSVWSLAERERLDLTALIDAYGWHDNMQYKAEIERLCQEAYGKWCRRRGLKGELEIITSGRVTSEAGEREYTEPVGSVAVNYNWET